jgi:hypothetical protein
MTRTAVTPHPGSGGTTSPTKHELIRFARLISDNAGLRLGTSKILRIVHRFHHRAPRGSGLLFFEHLAHEVGMTEKDRAKALRNEDIAHAVSGYYDPVPRDVIRLLQRQRGF